MRRLCFVEQLLRLRQIRQILILKGEQAMPVLTIQPSGKTYQAAVGSSILAALLTGGETIAHKCDGKAECGSCHISVLEGRKSLSKIQRAENERLDMTVGVSS